MLNQVKALLKKAHFSVAIIRRAVQLYPSVFPPPYRRANMEFDYDVWRGICTFHSQDGRQIGENNTNPEIYREDVVTEHKICTFEGSRNGLQINMTALRQVVRTFMEKGDLSVLNEEPVSADVLYEMADSSRALITASSDKACAGSKKLILDYLDVTMNGTHKKEQSSLEVRRWLGQVL